MRLSTKARVQELLDHGERWRSGPLYFHRLPAPPSREGKLGLLVAKKRFPSSVQRNRIRRLIREAWRARLRSADVRAIPWDVLISVGSINPAQIDLKEFERWLEEGTCKGRFKLF